ncbi:MAG TPA: c-type cytochrome [Anaerolineales bacterium]|nr:c-type cytochrome [Anaerolineales bacterium]
MSGFLKWMGVILGILIALILIAVASIYLITGNKLNRRYEIQVEPLEIPADAEAIARGEHLAKAVLLCHECHGIDLSGSTLDEGPMVATISMSNLTSGKGGIGGTYTDEDWVRAIRHGVRKDGKALLIMPSPWFYFLSDEDLASVIAYVKSIPPVDNELPERRIGPVGRFFVLMEPGLFGAEGIDHSAPRPPMVLPSETKEYGEYLANTCKNCHGDNLGGGVQVGAGLNLTPGGELANWTFEDFEQVMRFGVTPENRQILSDDMPWTSFKQLNDIEIKAIWSYLQSIPAVESAPETQAP